MNSLKGKKQIEILFSKGKKINQYPLTVIFLESEKLSLGVSVGKRYFKLAVDRNRIKRLLRVVLQKHFWPTFETLEKSFSVMLIYNSKDMPNSNILDKATEKLIKKLKDAI